MVVPHAKSLKQSISQLKALQKPSSSSGTIPVIISSASSSSSDSASSSSSGTTAVTSSSSSGKRKVVYLELVATVDQLVFQLQHHPLESWFALHGPIMQTVATQRHLTEQMLGTVSAAARRSSTGELHGMKVGPEDAAVVRGKGKFAAAGRRKSMRRLAQWPSRRGAAAAAAAAAVATGVQGPLHAGLAAGIAASRLGSGSVVAGMGSSSSVTAPAGGAGAGGGGGAAPGSGGGVDAGTDNTLSTIYSAEAGTGGPSVDAEEGAALSGSFAAGGLSSDVEEIHGGAGADGGEGVVGPEGLDSDSDGDSSSSSSEEDDVERDVLSLAADLPSSASVYAQSIPDSATGYQQQQGLQQHSDVQQQQQQHRGSGGASVPDHGVLALEQAYRDLTAMYKAR